GTTCGGDRRRGIRGTLAAGVCSREAHGIGGLVDADATDGGKRDAPPRAGLQRVHADFRWLHRQLADAQPAPDDIPADGSGGVVWNPAFVECRHDLRRPDRRYIDADLPQILADISIAKLERPPAIAIAHDRVARVVSLHGMYVNDKLRLDD